MALGPKAGSGRKPGRPKKAAIGDNSATAETKGLLLEHQRKLTETLRALEEAQSTHKHAAKAAKAAGLNADLILRAIKDRRKDPAELVAKHNTYLRYCRWMGMAIGQQGELFGEGNLVGDDHLTEVEDEEHRLWECGEAGYSAGRSGQDRTSANPHPAGSEPHVAWDHGYLKGQAAIAAEMGPNVTKAPFNRGKARRANPEDRQPEGDDGDTFH